MPSLEDEDTSFNPWQANQGITESFLALARDQHARGEVDAEVQVGLGVLYYQTGEYERARDCWVAALGVRPNVSEGSQNFVASDVELMNQIVTRNRIFCCGTDWELH